MYMYMYIYVYILILMGIVTASNPRGPDALLAPGGALATGISICITYCYMFILLLYCYV